MVASVDNVAIRWHGSDGWPDELLARLGMPELRAKWPQEVLELGARIGGGLTPRWVLGSRGALCRARAVAVVACLSCTQPCPLILGSAFIRHFDHTHKHANAH